VEHQAAQLVPDVPRRSIWKHFVGDREISVRAVHMRSERLKDLVSLAYREKYNTPGSTQYVKDMSRKQSRETTTDLVPM
jgi:hypothetical protein